MEELQVFRDQVGSLETARFEHGIQSALHYISTLEEILVAQDVAITTYEFAYFACNRIVTMPHCRSYVPSVNVYAVRGSLERVVNTMNSGFPEHRDVAFPVRLLAHQL